MPNDKTISTPKKISWTQKIANIFSAHKESQNLDSLKNGTIDFKNPDIQVEFTNQRLTRTWIGTGYRGTVLIHDGCYVSGCQNFINGDIVNYGETIISNINFILPETIPATLWIGRVLRVQEGNHIIGRIKVTEIFNPILDRDKAFPCSDPQQILTNQGILNKVFEIFLLSKSILPLDNLILRNCPNLSGQEIQILDDYIQDCRDILEDILLYKQALQGSRDFSSNTNEVLKNEYPWLSDHSIELIKRHVRDSFLK